VCGRCGRWKVTISAQTSRRCLTNLIGFMESASRGTGRRLPQLQGTWQVLSTAAAALYRDEQHDAVLSAVPIRTLALSSGEAYYAA
jgi:hypothetical protein